MTEEILKVSDLRLNFYTYEGVVQALDGVFLNLRKGETLGIVGETGCGKSVTGLSILNLVPPPGRIEGGQVVLERKGREVELLTEKEVFLRRVRGRDISMVFQDPRSALDPVYTAGDQIVEVLLHHRTKELIQETIERLDKQDEGVRKETEGVKKIESEKQAKSGKKVKREKPGFLHNFYKNTLQALLKNPRSLRLKIMRRIPILNGYRRLVKKEAKNEAVEILRIMRIPDPERVVGMYPHELSGGMAQRVVIAMALACDPDILIADEPTTNLDVTVQLQILQLIKELKERFSSSIIYITHDMGVVAEMCDRVAVMYAGSVVELAEVGEVFKEPLHPYTRALLESIPRPGLPFKSIEGIVPSLINPPKGCRFNDRCPYAMEVCHTVKPKSVEVKKNHFVECFLHE
jgi:peptide/nickel transport system ATP-binding protein